jgi:chromosome segregation ATPase
MLTEQNFSDIPKEELLQLCMKLNKRMQTMESKGKELLKKKNTLQTDREKLIKMMEFVMGISLLPSPDADLDLIMVEERWNGVLARLTQQNVAPVAPTLDDSSHGIALCDGISSDNVEVERFSAQDAFSRQQIQMLEAQVNTKLSDIDRLNKHIDDMKMQQEEQVVYLQMQLSSSKQREESRDVELKSLQGRLSQALKQVEEKDMTVSSNKEMLQALQLRLIELEPDLAQAKDKISTLQILKMEQDGVIHNMRRDLKLSLEDRENLNKKLKELEEKQLKSDGHYLKAIQLSEQVNKLTEELENTTILLHRLRTEAAINEKNHAMRTAMLATSEAQVESLQKDLTTKEKQSLDFVERISSLQTELSSLDHLYHEKNKFYTIQINSLEQEMTSLKAVHASELDSLKISHDEKVETMKKDNQKKSAMARNILSEREEEVRILSQKIIQLQEEITSGAPTERKIFEIAQSQSRRDAFNEQYK